MAAKRRSRPKFKTVAFIASSMPAAMEAKRRLIARYGDAPPEKADAIVALGGDGQMLLALRQFLGSGTPIYGMNRGSVGFLMNDYREDQLLERLSQADVSTIHPLKMHVRDADGIEREAMAINEVSMFRETYQAAKLRLSVDDKVRMEELTCDGVLVATPAGSTAYNLSAYGPILPINAQLLALTPICPFRPRRWRGALLPDHARIRIEVLEAAKRPVSAVADNIEFRSVIEVAVAEDASLSMQMMFDDGHTLGERILTEQFRY